VVGRTEKKKEYKRLINELTLHLSMLINSTCFPPNDVTDVSFETPTNSKTSDSFAPPHVATKRIKTIKFRKLSNMLSKNILVLGLGCTG
jgi:hypothetical protein